jgi:hypothetical protein
MTLGSWDPQSEQTSTAFEISLDVLRDFISLVDKDQLQSLADQLSPQLQQQQAPLMKLDQEPWQQLADQLSNADILSLIRFFTLAEQLPGWQAGDSSPVIWLTKIFKQRGEKLDKDLLLWIRSNSENRFLPYGSL